MAGLKIGVKRVGARVTIGEGPIYQPGVEGFVTSKSGQRSPVAASPTQVAYPTSGERGLPSPMAMSPILFGEPKNISSEPAADPLQQEKEALKRRRGKASTILTEGLGLLDEPPTLRRILLGA